MQGKGIGALFEGNVFGILPEIDRDMLHRLTVFPSFPLDMAAAALGMKRIRDVVAALMRENAFITKYENDEYRFPPVEGIPVCVLPAGRCVKRLYTAAQACGCGMRLDKTANTSTRWSL